MEKRKKKMAAKTLSKKSPTQNLFTSIRADRTTLYDPRNRRRTTSTSSNSGATSRGTGKKGKKAAGAAAKQQQVLAPNVKVKYQVDDVASSGTISGGTEKMVGIEDAATSDIDVVDTPPQDIEVAAQVVVSNLQTAQSSVLSKEQLIFHQMCQFQPFHDHCYTSVFGSFQHLYSDQPDQNDTVPSIATEVEMNSRTRGLKSIVDKSLVVPPFADDSKQILLKVNSGELTGTDLHIPILRLPGLDNSALEKEQEGPKIDLSLMGEAPSGNIGITFKFTLSLSYYSGF